MDFICLIKLANHEVFGYENAIVVENVENKKECIAYLLENYPEYYGNGKVSQKRTKNNVEETIITTIFELDDYWKKHWFDEITCKHCGKAVCKKYEKFNLLNKVGNIFCCEKCKNEYEKQLELSRFEDSEYYRKLEKYAYIYKITQKSTNKCYIGKTTNHYIWRWWQHVKAESGSEFHEFMRKIPHSDLTFEVLEILDKNEYNNTDILKIESDYIIKFDSINNGFNSVISKK